MNVVVHKGTLFTYRSYIYGNDLNVAGAAERATHNAEPVGLSVFVTEPVHHDLAGTPWFARLKPAEIQPRSQRLGSMALYHLDSRHR